jgi:hypothetical protein
MSILRVSFDLTCERRKFKMTIFWNYGVWTYRSFFNYPGPVGSIDDLLLAEGEMVFEAAESEATRGQLAFRSKKLDKSDARLALIGSLDSGSPGTIRFRGTGDATTSAKGWVYDYVGYLVPDWPSGLDQRPAIVGSVTRAVDHPGSGGTIHRAGEVFSFVAVRRDFPEPREVIATREVIPIAEPVLNMWHRATIGCITLSGTRCAIVGMMRAPLRLR